MPTERMTPLRRTCGEVLLDVRRVDEVEKREVGGRR